MTGIRNGINKNNSNVLDTYDSQWLNPNVVASTTIEIASAQKTKSALDELGNLVGKSLKLVERKRYVKLSKVIFEVCFSIREKPNLGHRKTRWHGRL